MSRRIPTISAAIFALVVPGFAQTSDDELVKQLNNPVASLISVPFQSNWDFRMGPLDRGTQYKLNFQPVIPISLNQDWNLIIRTIVPYINQEDVRKGPLPGFPGVPAAAEHYNEPGRFTAFIGYEWTSLDKGNNLHRNVIFRDNADRASQVEPFTCIPPLGSTNPIELWKWMDAYEKKTGGSVLAIAHNGNLSNGTMFPIVEAFGKAIDREYAEARARWERLYEATQTRATARRIPFSRRMTSSPTSRNGTKATSTAARRRKTRCSKGNTPARRSRAV